MPGLQATATASFLYWREVIVRVSLDHPWDCPCQICRAADGDLEASAELVAAVYSEAERARAR